MVSSHLASLNFVHPTRDINVIHKEGLLFQVFNVILHARLELRESQEVDGLNLFRVPRMICLFQTKEVDRKHQVVKLPIYL